MDQGREAARIGHVCQRGAKTSRQGSSLFFRQPRPEDFRSSSGSFTKLAAILLASPRVRSFAQALLKRVLLKRVLGPALLKRVLGSVWLRPMHRLCSAAT
jgi:hypothetical protein